MINVIFIFYPFLPHIKNLITILSIDYGKIDYDSLSSITQPQHSSAIYNYYDSNGKIMYSVEK